MPDRKYSLDHKIAIVTGGSKGIGKAIARTLAEHGADITLVARGRDALDAAKAEIETVGRQCVAISADMSDENQWTRIVDETIRALGGVDILVNNAGTADRYGPIVETGSDEWDRVMRVNLKAAFMMCKFCHPHMKRRGGGSIINVTSNEAMRPSAGLGAYSISKGAMVTLTQICAKEWGRDKIRVNCIAPGLIRTDMAKPLVRMVEKSGHYPNALKMIGEPEDIAGVALLLASDAGRYATGQTFVIDGGELVTAPMDD
jgi:dehydrogenase/reductase SDR family member 4